MYFYVLFVIFSLEDFEVFIKNSESGLFKKVEKGDFEGLVEVMGYFVVFKER